MDDRSWRVFRRHKTAMMGAAVLALFVALSLVAVYVSPYDPYQQVPDIREQGPTGSHILGTDDFGRDIFTRLWVGGRLSLMIGVLAVAVSALVGVSMGAVSGYFGGWADWLISRVIEILLAFPSILLAITIAAMMGRGLSTVIVAVGVVGIPQFARQVRASVLSIKETEYVTASRAMGSGPWRILFRHVMPNAMGPIIVLATMGLASAIISAAALSFLGLGVEPGTAEWGAMLYDGRLIFRRSIWLAMCSGAAITLTVLSVNLMGDGLRDALDPRSR